MARRRVAITGLGIISPLGLNLAANWESLRLGKGGIGPLQGISHPLLKMQNVAQVRGYDPLKHFEGGKDAYIDRFAQFSVVAAREALQDSAIALTQQLRENAAIVCGSAVGGQGTLEV